MVNLTVYVSDSFTRADSATTLGTTDSYNGGTAKTWTASDTWGISSNQAYKITDSSLDGVAVVDAGVSDNVSVSLDIPVYVSTETMGVVFRYQDANNYFKAVISGTTLYLQRYISGAKTTVGSHAFTATSPNTINVVLSGSSITINFNGVSVLTATDSNFTTATKFGMTLYQPSGTSARFDNFNVQSTGGGTDASITSVITNANASLLAPTVSTSSNVSVSSVVASSTADALAPQVGSFTNITINTVSANATASAINPSTSTTSNISLGAPISNAVASALVPNVGLSTSANIAAVIASLVVDGIAPNITSTQGISISSVVAGANASAMSPTIQKDLIIYAVGANSQASALSPNINGKLLVSTIYLKANQSLRVNLTADQSLQVNLKGAIN